MRSDRIEALARIAVQYSTRVRPGDFCTIEAPSFCAPFVLALAREIIRAGGHPVARLEIEGAGDAFMREAPEETLDWLAPDDVVIAERADVRIVVDAEWNTRSQTTADPERLARRSRARRPLRDLFFSRGASGELRWLVVGYPCEAAAQDAGMSLHDYEELLAATCLLDDPDPVARWEERAAGLERARAFLAGVDELRFVAPGGTDLRLRAGGRRWYAASGRENFPDGEVFTGPIEDSAEGTVAFSFPAVYRGREVDGVRMRFERGRVVEATAERGQEFLLAMLDQDEGARFLGEVAFGLNETLTEATRSTLLDEKIGGTFHLAVGASYPETGGVNVSTLHWDMVCDLRHGGEVWADGRLVYRDGRFLDGVLPA